VFTGVEEACLGRADGSDAGLLFRHGVMGLAQMAWYVFLRIPTYKISNLQNFDGR
jgi:hypothetical protein